MVPDRDGIAGVDAHAAQSVARSPKALLKRRLASGGAWVLGGRLAAALLALAANALLARLLSPKELGALATKSTVGIWTHAGLGLREFGGTDWRDVGSFVKSGSLLVGEFCRRNLRKFR